MYRSVVPIRFAISRCYRVYPILFKPFLNRFSTAPLSTDNNSAVQHLQIVHTFQSGQGLKDKRQSVDWGNGAQIISALIALAALMYAGGSYQNILKKDRLKSTDELSQGIKTRNQLALLKLLDRKVSAGNNMSTESNQISDEKKAITRTELVNLLDEFEKVYLYLASKTVDVSEIRHLLGWILFNLVDHEDVQNLLKEEPKGWYYFIQTAKLIIDEANRNPNTSPKSKDLVERCDKIIKEVSIHLNN